MGGLMSRLVPKLRFKEFSGEWEEKKLGDVSNINMGQSPASSSYNNTNNGIYLIQGNADIKDRFSNPRQWTTEPTKLCDIGDLILTVRAPVGYIAKSLHKTCIGRGVCSLSKKENNNIEFIYQFLLSYEKNWVSLEQGSTFTAVSGNDIKSLKINTPIPKEQQKIASCLSSLDALIEAQNKKVSALKQHKKGLMQQLFPAEGEREPKLRFKAFSGEWVEKKLGECLGYLQPTKYLVSDTNYNDDYDTPVLTAGKTFILGYTNEKSGIFKNNLPVIIFDDFTTATKYVDFPFKAKSSAMKILLAKESMNIKFMYELMQMIKYEVGNHERHWISKFALLDVLIPTPKEQQKIANTLSTLDNLIEAQDQKITQLKQHKKGLMQQLFVSSEVAHE
ncbi:Type I restriction-modification system, specificity subunit S [bacterium endosymbiont of Bathymodiolus sp. 5 South]|jgi:type I restriction enzyme S subunit|nr:Type I restriction-modification system, specificity subunit S [bacterium endosymbiont of Bathymodiolus sp. 5 South]VVH60079.1 Type I restriction-modification system, specificity subunit S (EC [uncultured Gammaproteobacteria bacterium]